MNIRKTRFFIAPAISVAALLLAACGPQSETVTIGGSSGASESTAPEEAPAESESAVSIDAPSAANALPTPAVAIRDLEIITLLPFDAIPAIDNPQFYPVAEADQEYGPEELVLGVSINGQSRAYSTALLSRHEIVNDTVGGRKIAVTW